MTVLVTGGAGYVGALAVAELLSRGHSVRVLDSLLHGQDGIARELEADGAEVIQGDVRDAAARACRGGCDRGGTPRGDSRRPRLCA